MTFRDDMDADLRGILGTPDMPSEFSEEIVFDLDLGSDGIFSEAIQGIFANAYDSVDGAGVPIMVTAPNIHVHLADLQALISDSFKLKEHLSAATFTVRDVVFGAVEVRPGSDNHALIVLQRS